PFTNSPSESTWRFGTSLTVIVTKAEFASSPSLAVSWKTRSSVPTTFADWKLGAEVSAEYRMTDVPPTCVHVKVSGDGRLSGSDVPEPSSVTIAQQPTVCIGPALTTGGAFGEAVTINVNVWTASRPQSSVAVIVPVYVLTGPAFVMLTTPVVGLIDTPPVYPAGDVMATATLV